MASLLRSDKLGSSGRHKPSPFRGRAAANSTKRQNEPTAYLKAVENKRSGASFEPCTKALFAARCYSRCDIDVKEMRREHGSRYDKSLRLPVGSPCHDRRR